MAAVLAGLATILVMLLPALHFAYRQYELHIGFEAAAALIGLLAAYLTFGRFLRRRRLDDLMLFVALALFALANLFFAAMPAMVLDVGSAKFTAWAALSGRLLGASALALAALLPPRRLRLSHPVRLLTVLTPVTVLIATGVVVGALSADLPSAVQADLSPEISGRPRLVGHPAVLAAQLVAMVFFTVAAIGFLRRSIREQDGFVGWLAVASVFAAFARLHYFLYPTLYAEWVYTGDAFRLLFYVVIFGAALGEIRSYWKVAAEAAVFEERRRAARDLHDGLAQELAVVSRNLKRLDADNAYVRRASAAVARGLDDARRAIAALAEPVDEPLDVALGRVARAVAEREGTTIALALAPGIRTDMQTREALVRIVGEAITNAARHGHADLVRVELEAGKRVRLRVTDTGRGFDPSAAHGNTLQRFGVRGMRERAEALGGELRLITQPGHGTELEVVL